MADLGKRIVKKKDALVDLNVNPCKMCMPMGSATAAYGVQGCVTILHGSQGCATYIRRHMATHYNEPVDIASSALTEQGTVYGGEENLHKGIDNLIRLYDPKAICVSTTCLAETIGEDVPGMLDHWREKHPTSPVVFVPVASPGYGGTQFEGYFRFVRSLIETIDMKPESVGEHQLNIVCGPMSPADMRFLTDLVAAFGINAVIVPDLSDNLDRARLEVYDRTPTGGTPIERVASMAGSDLTIELATFVPAGSSPGEVLEKRFGIPCTRLNLPVGLRDIDALIDALASFAGVAVPESIQTQRGRYLDAMIDSHKYNAEGRAVVFGEPDFCYAVTRMCVEEGIVPVVVATGSKCPEMAAALEDEVRDVAERILVDRWTIMDDADFGDIERLAVEHGANVMIGSSDGRRIEDKHGIPLIRCAFPVHDHIGGQRIRMIGYEGSLMLLDRITNTLLQRKETGFRAAIRDEFYDNTLLAQAHRHRETESYQVFAEAATTLSAQDRMASSSCGDGSDIDDARSDIADDGSYAADDRSDRDELVPPNVDEFVQSDTDDNEGEDENERARILAKKTAQHPCFNGGCVSKNARIHLAVAPQCNISCNYCVRKYDCVNESRPGVTSTVLTPHEALERFKLSKERIANLTTVGIAGPGDALADWDHTSETLRLIHDVDPDVTFCLSTNGLLLPRYADEIADLGVTHVTVTMNAIDPAIGARIYGFVRLDGVTYRDTGAAAVLLANQVEGIRLLIARGVMIKVNTVLISGVNESHVEAVGEFVAKLGVSFHNVMQHIPVPGSVFGDLPQVSRLHLDQVRAQCSVHLPQMYHCQQCRADAVGKLTENLSYLIEEAEGRRSIKPIVPNPIIATLVAPDGASKRPRRMLRMAVASRSGMMVDTHFGHATSFMVYEGDGVTVRYVETRDVDRYCTGQEFCTDDEKESRLHKTLAAVQDCAAVLCLRIGQAPLHELLARDIVPIVTCDAVSEAVVAAQKQLASSGDESYKEVIAL